MTKKRFITLLIAIVMVATMLTGCGEETPKTITSETLGSYSLFKTTDVQEYLAFLENFDESKYEIIDISASMEEWTARGDSAEFYMVTYKMIVE